MLPYIHKVVFLVFAVIAGALGLRGFYRLYRRIAAGRPDTDRRLNHIAGRMWYALRITLMQSRTFRKRPLISVFHSFIFYGFAFYLLVNLVDAVEGYITIPLDTLGVVGHIYVLLA